jgi:hypothetical protein
MQDKIISGIEEIWQGGAFSVEDLWYKFYLEINVKY